MSNLTGAEGMDIFQLKRKVVVLYPTLESFNGIFPISFLKLFDKLSEAFDAVGT